MALLELDGISKLYDNKTVLKDFNYSFNSSNCVALIGPNGAGKTTCLRIIAGIIKASRGQVTMAGYGSGEDIRKHIGYLPQYPAFHSWMTGKEYLVYSGGLAFIPKSEATSKADLLLKRVGIYEARNQRIGKYSGGMKQRLGIAQAIIHSPKILILDEPVSSLDPIGRREILTLTEELKKDMTIIFSTHILSDAEEVSDELIFLNKGQIVESGDMNYLREKYKTVKFELSFSEGTQRYADEISKMPEVSEARVEEGVVNVSAYEIEAAKKSILGRVLKDDWPLTMFVVNRTSLEDVFLKVVKSKCNG